MRRALALAALLAVGCRDTALSPDLERMKQQQRYAPYEESPYFEDTRVMRPPVAGTIRRERVLGPPALTTGIEAGRYVARSPVPLTRALLETGRERYDIYCAACHGLVGDGASEVATNMTERRPPSLLHPLVRAFPDGRIYEVIARGYGLMPAYANQLSLEERWATVAWVRVLERAGGARAEELPPPLAAEARRVLSAGARP